MAQNYCECPFPAPYHTEGKCGRCLRLLEPELGACATCQGEGRIDFMAKWHGPPNVERHHWHPCPDCDGMASRD